jgi:GDPmannose 4,6-dehydratase
MGLARYLKDQQSVLELGNLEARRDWGHARDYVEAMWLMLQQEGTDPEDFVIGTGQTHTIKEFVQEAAKAAGLKLDWRGQGPETEAIDEATGNVILRINPEFYRPAEVDLLLADPRKAYEKLNWVPKISFEELAKRMMLSDLKVLNS